MGTSQSSIIKIAVTGHRFLTINDSLTHAIRSVLEQLIQEHKGMEIQLLSPLAEGSDQLVAEIASSYSGVQLIVPLPLPEEEYLRDFASNLGQETFHELMQRANRVLTLSPQIDHPTAYEYLGKYLLEQCGVLIAIWNGDYVMKKGGTGEVVREALGMGKSIYWIYAWNGNEAGESALRLQKNPGDIEVLGSPEVTPHPPTKHNLQSQGRQP